jgi:hypothetical protein
MSDIRYWINTRTIYEWDGTQYVKTEAEGYWYDGPIALAEGEGAEGDPNQGGNGGDPPPIPDWAAKIEDDGLKTAVAGFESQDKLFEAIGYEPPKAPEPEDWREGLPEELAEVAKRFTSKEDALRAVVDLRKRESQIRVPGKDATDAEKTAYLKAIGVPEKPEEYTFPTLPEDQMTDEVKASREEWSKRFHDLHIPKETARTLIEAVAADAAKQEQAQAEADKAFVKASEDALRSEWKGAEYDKNLTLANRAFSDIAGRAGLNVEELRKIETKDGRFLLDRPEMLRVFSLIGREMAEGTLGPTLTDSELETIDEQVRTLRQQQEEAKAAGDNKRANQLYEREQALIAKKQGNKPVVGASGRAV